MSIKSIRLHSFNTQVVSGLEPASRARLRGRRARLRISWPRDLIIKVPLPYTRDPREPRFPASWPERRRRYREKSPVRNFFRGRLSLRLRGSSFGEDMGSVLVERKIGSVTSDNVSETGSHQQRTIRSLAHYLGCASEAATAFQAHPSTGYPNSTNGQYALLYTTALLSGEATSEVRPDKSL